MRRAAFTLVELLVCVGIVGLLAALVLPAVQKVRAAAGRAACQGNARQYALAFLSYESAAGELPAGGEDPGLMGGGWPGGCKWVFDVAPYMERRNLGRPLGCPGKAPSPGGSPRVSYAAADRELAGMVRQDGFTGRKLVEVRDGLGNTLMLGELWCDPAAYSLNQVVWSGGRIGVGTPRYTSTAARTCRERVAPDGSAAGSVFGFGGPHAAGAVCAYGDGSVRVVGWGIDPAVWRAGGTVAGGD